MAEAKVYISGPILSKVEPDTAYPYCLAQDVDSQLDWQKPFDSVRVVINSPGGHVTEGFAIYDKLRALGPDITITTEAIGQCSSIATAIFLAGSVRLIHEHTDFLIHLPSGGYSGMGAAGAQAFADEMAACEEQLINLYVERAGVDGAAIAELMAAQTMLDSSRVYELGFATAVVQPITALAILTPKSAAAAPSPSSQPQPAAPASSTIMSKFNSFISKMKTAFAELEQPKTALSVTTSGDNPITLTIDTGDREAYAVGDMVYTDAEMTTAAPDGDHLLTDGNTITTAEGAITAITEPTTDVKDGDITSALQALAEGVTLLTNEVRSMKTASAATTKKVETLQTNYTTLARSVKTNAAAPPDAAKPNADADDTDKDPVTVAADRRAARRANRYPKA